MHTSTRNIHIIIPPARVEIDPCDVHWKGLFVPLNLAQRCLSAGILYEESTHIKANQWNIAVFLIDNLPVSRDVKPGEGGYPVAILFHSTAFPWQTCSPLSGCCVALLVMRKGNDG